MYDMGSDRISDLHLSDILIMTWEVTGQLVFVLLGK